MSSHEVDLLKLLLKSALKRKFINEKLENKLRNTELKLSEEICILKNEMNLLMEHLEVLTRSISEIKYQTAMIEICNVSEQSKIKQQVDNLITHTEGFKDLYAKDQNLLQLHYDELNAKKVEAEALKNKELEINEQQKKKALTLDEECDTIESECNVLKKRNKAIMLKLRHKLLEIDEIRREVIRNKSVEKS